MANLVCGILGQSNAQGQGLNADIPAATLADLAAVAARVNIYLGAGCGDAGKCGAWAALGVGFGYDIDHFGPEVSLGIALARAYPTDTIYLVKHAEGSTNLSADWLPPAGATWVRAAATIAAALAGVAAPVPIGCVWLQGESDANGTAANALAYRDNIATLIDAVRVAFAAPRLPFSMMAVSEVLSYPYSYRVRSGQYAATRRRPLVWAIDSTGLPWAGGVHFTAAGILSLGAMLASPLQARTSRPLIAAPGRCIEDVPYCPASLVYSNQMVIADHTDLRPGTGDCGFGGWVRAQPHPGAQALWTIKGTGGDWRPFYQNSAGCPVAYANDNVTFAMATATVKARDLWDYYWTTINRTTGKLELWRNLDMIADAALGTLADVAPTGNLNVGYMDLASGDIKVNDLIWRKGAVLTWDEVRRYLTQGIPFPTAGTKQITWGMREGSGTACVSVPAGYNGTLAGAAWTTKTRQHARVAAP
jgi:hypothetical protein